MMISLLVFLVSVVSTAKLGTGFALVKSDVGGNIDRLEKKAETNPDLYNPDIFEMIRIEVKDGTAAGASSCTKGLLWLKRAMEFITALLSRLLENPTISLSEAASETYYETLQQYHGWIVTGTFTVALKLCPSRDYLFESIMSDTPIGNDSDLLSDMKVFLEEFGSIIQEIHTFLSDNGLDDPTKV